LPPQATDILAPRVQDSAAGKCCKCEHEDGDGFE
jgi:hypothetical protein